MNKPSTAALLLGLLVGAGPIGAETAPEVAWVRQIGTSNSDRSNGVAVDSAGNAYISGHTYGSLSGPNAGGIDAFVTRYNADGSLAWTRQIGTSSNDWSNGVAVDRAGNAYITGYTQGSLGSPNAGVGDAFVTRYNTDGSHAWTRQLGTSSDERSTDVAVDIAGNAYITGHTGAQLYGPPDLRGGDGFLTRYNADGSHAWTRQFGTSKNLVSSSVSVDGAGNAYISGSTYGSLGGLNAGNLDAFLSRYSADGSLEWTRQLGTRAREEGNGVAVDSAGNAYISGSTSGSLGGPNAGHSDAFLARYNADGDLAWSRQIGTSDFDKSYGVTVDSAGNAYITGDTYGSLGGTNAGVRGDAFLARYNADGSLAWTRQIGTNHIDTSNGVAVDSAGNAYISGYTRSTLDAPNDYNVGGRDAFLVKFENTRPLTATPVDRTPTPEQTPGFDDLQPDPVPEGVDYSTQLVTYNAGAFSHDPGSIQTDRPTVILTHGWNSQPGTFDDLAHALAANGSDVNILAWDWQSSAGTGKRLRVASSRTPAEGKALAQALQDSFGAGHDQPVHFIGHSLGTLVGAEAIEHLHNKLGFDPNGTIPVQATLLDNAEVAGGLTELLNGLSRNAYTKPFPKDADWIDNYVSLVGYFDDSAANAFVTDSAFDNFISQHRYPIDWYTQSIEAVTSGNLSSRLGFSQAISNAGINDFDQSLTGSYWRQTLSPFDSDLALTESNRAVLEVLRGTRVNSISIGNSLVDFAGEKVGEVTTELFDKIDQSLTSSFGSVREAMRIRLFENSPAYYWLDVEVPEDAFAVEFDFMFSDMSEEDFLTFAIDEELLFALEGEVVDQDELLSSGLMNVEEWQGQNVEFFFGYNSDDITGGQIMIEDPRFYQVPEPTSLALLALGGLVLSHRRRR